MCTESSIRDVCQRCIHLARLYPAAACSRVAQTCGKVEQHPRGAAPPPRSPTPASPSYSEAAFSAAQRTAHSSRFASARARVQSTRQVSPAFRLDCTMYRRAPPRPVRTGRRQHHCARRSNERLHRRIFEIGFVHLRVARVGGRWNGAAQAVPLSRAIHAPTACSPRLPKPCRAQVSLIA